MEVGTSLQSTVSSMVNTRNTSRRHRPLRTCAVTVLTVAHKAYTRAEHVHGPIGILSQKLATLLGPIIYVVLYQYLSTLSFIDRRFLTIEKITEWLFPPSAYVFDKIDRLVEVSETVPDKFDEVADKWSRIIYKVPLTKWAIARLNSVLHFLIVILTDWGIHIAAEKEIVIDSNSQDSAYEVASSGEEVHDSGSLPVSVNDGERTGNRGSTSTIVSAEVKGSSPEKSEEMFKETEEKGSKKVQPTYKEILEMGSKKEQQKTKGVGDEAAPRKDNVGKDVKATVGGMHEDPILELFATAWHMH